jgi:hypothetical protein
MMHTTHMYTHTHQHTQVRSQQQSSTHDAHHSLSRRLHPDLTTSHITGQNSMTNITSQTSFSSSYNGKTLPGRHRDTNSHHNITSQTSFSSTYNGTTLPDRPRDTNSHHNNDKHSRTARTNRARPHTQMELTRSTVFSNPHDSDSDSILLFHTATQKRKNARTVQGLSRIRPHSQQDFVTHSKLEQMSRSGVQDFSSEKPRKSAVFSRETRSGLRGSVGQNNTDSRSSVDLGVGLNLVRLKGGPENSVPERERSLQMNPGKNCPALLSDCQQHIFTSECVCACMCVCTYVYRRERSRHWTLCMCIYMYTQIYIYTYIHTHK